MKGLKANQSGSVELVVIGLAISLILMIALPVISDVASESNHEMQRLCVNVKSHGKADLTENGQLTNTWVAGSEENNMVIGIAACAANAPQPQIEPMPVF